MINFEIRNTGNIFFTCKQKNNLKVFKMAVVHIYHVFETRIFFFKQIHSWLASFTMMMIILYVIIYQTSLPCRCHSSDSCNKLAL